MIPFTPGIFKLSLRQLIGRHRLLLLAFIVLLAAVPALIAFLIQLAPTLSTSELQTTAGQLYDGLILAFVLPVIALILSGTVLREEIQAQTINYLVLKPISRAAIVFSKWAAVAVIALPLSALSILSTSVLLKSDSISVFLASGLLATLAYLSLFFLLSLLVDRVLIAGFAFLLVWEGVVANFSKLASLLSVHVYAKNIEQALLNANQPPEIPLLNSVITLVAITFLSLALASWKLAKMEFPGSSE